MFSLQLLFAIGNSSDVFLILRAQQIGIPALMIPIVYLLFNLIYSISAIPAGIAADRFGRKRVILLGFMLFAVLYYGFAIAGRYHNYLGLIRFLWPLYGTYRGHTKSISCYHYTA